MNVWEIILCAFLAFLLAVVLGGLNIAGVFRKWRLKEPPLDKGFIPWLGHALHFRKNPVEFLERMQKKHGNIFTVLLGGNYLHVVMDPHTYGTVIKESKDKLDFDTFASMVVLNAFGFRPTECHHKVVQTMSKKHLRGKRLTDLNQVMMEKLQAVLLPSQDSSRKERSWQEDGVFNFSYKTIFQAAVMSLFGTEPGEDGKTKENATEHKVTQWDLLFENFKKFDHIFPQLAFDMLDPLGKKEAETLRNFFWHMLSVEKIGHKDNISSWVTEQDQSMAETGMTEKMRTQFQLLLFWASQANTGPATSWLLVHLLKYPEAMKAVREELDKVLKETGQEVKPGSPFIQVSLNAIKTPFLDSTIEETLRLRASSFMFRGVVQDMDLRTADRREYMLRKGDNVLLVPFIGLHLNPEIHPDPHTFKYDRFVKPDGTKKEFYKDGKKLKYPIMPWGGGPSMCPGRFFAISELKLFVIVMLSYFDMELVNQDEDIPPFDDGRFGLGVVPPTHDIQFRYRLKF
ncbi:7-alpha-hydroxycholest-4-en-3-one 12-alpha-hydroxylase-like [Tiliqua scincoides]|uniref:7-alpha-hydroxycholest-4-en-3-one 12-alpha-hydroxylase-like n=1 Tax=Tiliqua scincoides TaxID=71010 RepID=UPI003462CBF4